jgi:glycosyltransferase involved in cell wall biosynthesis
MGLLFYPRGGSAQVVRYLARFLPAEGWEVALAAGSLGPAGAATHAASFFEGSEVHAVDYTAAAQAPDPLAADPPFHPSYEDRPGAPDRVFAAVGDEAYERLVATWERELAAAGADRAEVLHLHHLTPINEAAARAFPDKPVVGHVHGTEILMLDALDRGPPAGWEHAEAWASRMRRWARRCARLLVLSPDAAERVRPLLGVDPDRVVWAPNGFEPGGFDRRPLGGHDRLAVWRRWLVEEPRGWRPGAGAGSVAYSEADLEAFDGGEAPVLVYVGRFTAVKRLPLLVRAYARARERFTRRAPLVLLGGHPGEWEGEHPFDAVEASGARDVFLAGWRSHDELPEALNAAHVTVLPSVHEQFGQVIVEGMACGLPAIAVDAHGPATIVEPGETGWLVPADDEFALADALVEAVNDPGRRAALGMTAYERARARYAWPALAQGVARVYEEVVRGAEPHHHALGVLPEPGAREPGAGKA